MLEFDSTSSPSPWSRRWAYGDTVAGFLGAKPEAITGALANASAFADEPSQKHAWRVEIELMKSLLASRPDAVGGIWLEYDIPRLGSRVDVILAMQHVLFVIEFKVGARRHDRHAIEQAWDYALDLKNFHEPSHHLPIVPVLVATESMRRSGEICIDFHHDNLAHPVCCNGTELARVIDASLRTSSGPDIDTATWQAGRYRPTPTIIEAARALYGGHKVEEISRTDASARNLGDTTNRLAAVIEQSSREHRKAICFVTGVPGAGKTLVGLDIANRHTRREDELYSVYLSGNGPLVAVLHEALARDHFARANALGESLRIGKARSAVKQFIQNVHRFRDECLVDTGPPVERVALFDEAQRAWNMAHTARFMQQRKGHADFSESEPQFLISCMDRHKDWAVIVCLVGSGQEINTGEAGIGEWLRAVRDHFPHWDVHLSPRLQEMETQSRDLLNALNASKRLVEDDALHLSSSVRSFRAERVSGFVNQLLAMDFDEARRSLEEVLRTFPIFLTRSIDGAKRWLRDRARGSERFGVVVSSQAQRLKPYAIDVRVRVDPVRWFLEDREDVRSSLYLEDAATEFQVQGLELDWTCVVWDADLRFLESGWDYFRFKGKRWERIRKEERQRYLLNAYRVLLTRARQGMVIVLPEGDREDHTRAPAFYDPAFRLLREIGIPELADG